MSDKKPNVFGTPDVINQNQAENVAPLSAYGSPSEEAAALEMKRRTEDQLRARQENLEKNEKIAREIDAKRESQLQEKVQYTAQESVMTKPIAEPTINYPQQTVQQLSAVEVLSQPQMNQAFDLIPLPSEGKLYPSKKKSIKVAYLTTADENILTSPNLVESGDFLEILINRKILEPELRYKDLHTGDRNAIMVWLRATGYGAQYPVQMLDENNKVFETEIDLSSLGFIKLGAEPDFEGLFYFKMPLSGDEIKFKLLTTGDVDVVEDKMRVDKENNIPVNNEPTYVLQQHIVEVNGNRDNNFIQNFVNNIRTLDAQKLRDYVSNIESGIDLNVNVKTPGGGSITTFLPINPSFFWPNARV